MTNKVFRGSSDFNYASPLKTRRGLSFYLPWVVIGSLALAAIFLIYSLVVAKWAEQEAAEASRKLQWINAERTWHDQGCRVKSFVSGRRGSFAEYREVWHCPDGTVHLGRATDDK